jgi:hypothetical protein
MRGRIGSMRRATDGSPPSAPAQPQHAALLLTQPRPARWGFSSRNGGNGSGLICWHEVQMLLLWTGRVSVGFRPARRSRLPVMSQGIEDTESGSPAARRRTPFSAGRLETTRHLRTVAHHAQVGAGRPDVALGRDRAVRGARGSDLPNCHRDCHPTPWYKQEIRRGGDVPEML